jgi:hypothetical protein
MLVAAIHVRTERFASFDRNIISFDLNLDSIDSSLRQKSVPSSDVKSQRSVTTPAKEVPILIVVNLMVPIIAVSSTQAF